MDPNEEYNFTGQIPEIPAISVDKFLEHNIQNSEMLFLTHCHSDHMVGLYDDYNCSLIVENAKRIYTSPISRIILQNTFPTIKDNVEELDLKSTTTFTLNNNYNLSVTPISASHCPGSVMFLFEINGKRILFTGDYRITAHDLKRFKIFYDSFNQLKTIDKIYLDTTFFLSKYNYFPKRHESLKELNRIIQEWINKPKQVVHLHIGAKYGYEFLFLEIYKYFRMPIHVSDEIYNIYSYIPEMDQAITKNFESTRIHCSCGVSFNQICLPIILGKYSVRKIKITALIWQNLNEGDISIVEDENNQIFRICYSTHASLSEGMGVIRFLKPKNIFPFVSQRNSVDQEEMISLLNRILKEIHDSKNSSEEEESDLKTNKNGLFLFNVEESNKPKKSKAQSKTSTKVRSLLDSP